MWMHQPTLVSRNRSMQALLIAVPNICQACRSNTAPPCHLCFKHPERRGEAFFRSPISSELRWPPEKEAAESALAQLVAAADWPKVPPTAFRCMICELRKDRVSLRLCGFGVASRRTARPVHRRFCYESWLCHLYQCASGSGTT